MKITDLSPQIVWKYFNDISLIPRPSGHEEKVIQYLKEFAETNNLEHIIDKVGNIIIKKKASSGKENSKGVILQAHVDIVPQKNRAKIHDFVSDPIETIVDGEWLRANQTTLGADNGIGVAVMLAVLESEDVVHGPIEALFTINEEAGMDGAFGLEAEILKGEIMINLDSEEEGEIFIGCAGGVNVNVAASYKEEFISEGKSYEIIVSGLKGGHSGVDIALGRANSNKITGRILWSVFSKVPVKISSIKGGDMRNAIPREAHAIIVVPEEFDEVFKDVFYKEVENIKNEFKYTEPKMSVEIHDAEMPGQVADETETIRIICMIKASPNGVVRMSDEMPGTVESSLNLSIVEIFDGNAKILYLVRSAVDTANINIAEEVRALHESLGGIVEFDGRYPGWRPNRDSYILNQMMEVYNSKYNITPKITAIHAGLECGIIGGTYPKLDMISIGPTIRHPHSPEEKVEIASVDKFWEFIKETLKNI